MQLQSVELAAGQLCLPRDRRASLAGVSRCEQSGTKYRVGRNAGPQLLVNTERKNLKATMKKTRNEPLVKRAMDAFPGKKWFGLYRFLPFFFLLGASLEFSMINWTVGDVNFYKTYKKRQALDYLEAKKHSVEEN